MAIGDRIYVTPQPTIADLFDATLIYNKGDIVYHLNTLYTRNLTATAALAWDATKWDEVIATLGFVKLNGDPKASQKVNGAITFSNDGCAAVQIEIANETDPLISAKKPGFGPDTLVEYDGTHTADWINWLNWSVGFNNDTVPELDDSKNQYVRVTMSDDVDFKASKWDTTLKDEITEENVRFKMFYRTVYSADGNASLNQYLGGYLYKTVKLAGVTNPFPKGWYAGRRKNDTLYTKKIYAVLDDINYAKITGNKIQIGQGSEVKDWTGSSTNAAIAIGKNSSACYGDQIVIGSNSSIVETGNQYSTIIGSYNKNVNHSKSIIIGNDNNLKGNGSGNILIAFDSECGSDNTGSANATDNVAIGAHIKTYGMHNTSVGYDAYTYGEDNTFKDLLYATALGVNSWASSNMSTALGSYSSAKKGAALSIGYNAFAELDHAVAIGKEIRAGYKLYIIGSKNTSGRSDRNISKQWTSGSNYTKGTLVYSRLNPASNEYHVYRAKNDITGSTTYPYNDYTNWQDLIYDTNDYPFRFAVVFNDTQFQVEQTGKAMIRTGLKVGYLNTDENIYGYNLCSGSNCKILGSSANYCFAGGNGCQIKNSSYYVLCYGNNNEVNCSGATCIGLYNQIMIYANTATTIGYHNYINNYSSSAVALGYYNSIGQYSNNSVAIGDNNYINNTTTVNQTCFAFGKKNQSNSNGFMALGNENTVAYTGAFAFGDHLKASGTALVLGYNYYLNDAPHPVWDNTTTYMINDIVLYDNHTYYRSKIDNNVGIFPTTTASWLQLEITDARIDKHVIIGLDTKKVLDANHDGDVRVYNDVYINDGSTGAKKVANLNQISDAFSEASAYAKGSFCIYKNVLYKANEAITAGAWDATKWTATKLTAELGGAPVKQQITLELGDWDGSNKNEVTVSGMSASKAIVCTPVPEYREEWINSDIFVYEQTTDKIIFKCSDIPTQNVVVDLIVW